MILFFYPYIMLCYSAGYALLQTLDGMGVISTNFVEMNAQGALLSSYWSPNKVAVVLGGCFLELFILLLPFVFLSSWILARKKGLIICFVLLITPGLLSLCHLLPAIQWLPLTYEIGGTGATGNAAGLGSLSLIGLLCGWILAIIISDIFATGEKFRQWIDIFLILTAVGNGMFWVSDREVAVGKTAYEETITDINDAAKYLLVQVKDYSRMCDNNGLSEMSSCQWASYIQETLENIASTKSSVIEYVIPENLDTFYKIPEYYSNQVSPDKIRQEFQDFNKKLCPNKSLSKTITQLPSPSRWCQTPPPAYCNAIQEGKYKTGMSDRFAVANECVTTSLLRYRQVLLKEQARLSLSKNAPHYRWMWFIAMSFFIGGKIANVMTKIGNVENRLITEKYRVKFILLKIFSFIVRTLIICAILCRKVFFSTFNFIKRLKEIKRDT
ncbi:hypothetical protein KV802_001443 [Salmonella enterica subsp. enterica serovar Corvallis]|uniref:hypothetical protein n=1 Tax=Salmonella enterica TaxID=28901 RepID=UPI001033892B|nr:hypothetical protein [Salmonella enterica]EDR7439735.1 hypothetical protein [Salmonella enterica subsp. enterica serovar Hato]EHS5456487.1 hypothetical protein [Salmonella enterica subsp. enterica serovar Corvallis]TBN69260.1 hypothetical protein EYZ56_02020 [Salmonella enterica subsp. enterica]EBE5434104.1 hypothetical protein [Salmonella enterica]